MKAPLKLQNLKGNRGARKLRTRVGRGEGSGHGKTSGRGGKGQTARNGGGVRPGFEGGQMPLYRRLPKVGFTSRKSVRGANDFNVINLDSLQKLNDGTVVDATMLREMGYAKRASKKRGVKILSGKGEFSKKLTFKVNAISETARQKIESLGGSVELLSA